MRALIFYMHEVRLFGGLGPYSQAMQDLSEWMKSRSKNIDAVLVSHPHLQETMHFWNPDLPAAPIAKFGPDLSSYGSGRYVLEWRREIRHLGYAKCPDVPASGGLSRLADPERNFFSLWEAEIAARGYKKVYVVRYNAHPILESVVDLVFYWAVKRGRSLELKARFFDRDGTPMFEVYLLKSGEIAPASPFRRFDPVRMAF